MIIKCTYNLHLKKNYLQFMVLILNARHLLVYNFYYTLKLILF